MGVGGLIGRQALGGSGGGGVWTGRIKWNGKEKMAEKEGGGIFESTCDLCTKWLFYP